MNGGERELAALVGMAEAIQAMLPAPADAVGEWLETAGAFAASVDLASPEAERGLDELGFALRSAWLWTAHEVSHRHLMAPLHEAPKRLPSGRPFQFDYERYNRPEYLERRVLEMTPPPPRWAAHAMVFSTGMAAMATLVQVCCAHLNGAMPDEPARLAIFGGYFETWRLLDMFHGPALEVAHATSNAELADAVSDGVDIAVIEPVAYDWDMTVFDLAAFTAAWARAEQPPRVVVVDTSLTGPAFGMADLTRAFGDRPPWMVLWMRSGLKLDQQGLELFNVGIVTVCVPEGPRPFDIGHLMQRLTVNRAVTGGGLDINRAAALESPWFLDADGFAEHAGRVFANNRRLALGVVVGGGLFARIGHPALLPGRAAKWAVAPFVVFQLADGSVGHLGFLVAVIVEEARRRGLCLDLGSSFGFRGRRF